MMLSTVAAAEFADKYSDHLIFASSAGTGTVLSEIWRVVPVEVAALLTAVVFIAARVGVERLWHRHSARKRAARNAAHRRKSRSHVPS